MDAGFLAPVLPPVRGGDIEIGYRRTVLANVWPHGVTSLDHLLTVDERLDAYAEELAWERLNAACDAAGGY